MHKSALFGTIILFWVACQAHAQDVVIHRATPATVVELLKAELLPQGFALESANDKGALFTLDRGMVAQRGNRLVPLHTWSLSSSFVSNRNPRTSPSQLVKRQ